MNEHRHVQEMKYYQVSEWMKWENASPLYNNWKPTS
jgi:hypothetical protein